MSVYILVSLSSLENDMILIWISKIIEIAAKPRNIVVGIIYRPPNDKLEEFKESLVSLLQKIDLQNKKCFLMGDFTLDLLKTEENQHIKDFTNLMFSSTFSR